jgi:hypothetical protein
VFDAMKSYQYAFYAASALAVIAFGALFGAQRAGRSSGVAVTRP